MHHEWFYFKHNPLVMHSEPPGFEIWKLAELDYVLHHMDDNETIEPLWRGSDWNVGGAIADRVVTDACPR